MMRRSLIAVGILACCVVGDGCFVQEKCGGDAECGANQICVDGHCEQGCRLTRDCPEGLECIGSHCTPRAADPDAGGDGGGCPDITCPQDMVPVCRFCIDAYEASRVDATEDWEGSDVSYAVSVAGVRPWTNTPREVAAAACDAAGKRLCSYTEWIIVCRGPADTAYPYGDTYAPTTCNGIDAFGRDNLRLMPTGSMPDCVNDFGAYDMSGNVWEIDADVPGWVHGGAYNCIDSAKLHMCSYNQDFGPDPRSNVGFRCCSDGL